MHTIRVHISLILAASENNMIGDSSSPNHALPWDLPNDLAHFRAITKGKPIIMGRKTHEFIGRVLPGRANIVVTRDSSRIMEGAVAASSIEEAIHLAKADMPAEVFVAGGGEIYRQALPLADKVYMTRVHAQVEGDTTFPDLDPRDWQLMTSERHEPDEAHQYAYTFLTYDRIKQ
jgi:dihydrofolate reductase